MNISFVKLIGHGSDKNKILVNGSGKENAIEWIKLFKLSLNTNWIVNL